MSTKAKNQKTAAAQAPKAAEETLEHGDTAAEVQPETREEEKAPDAGSVENAGAAGDMAGPETTPEPQEGNAGADEEAAEDKNAAAPVGSPAPETDIAHVYCKLPAGMTFQLPGGQRLVLNGSNSSRIVGGYGITRVPAALWDQVKKLFGNMPAFTKGLIFDESTAARGLARAREQADIKNGFEGVDPKNPGPGVTPDDGK